MGNQAPTDDEWSLKKSDTVDSQHTTLNHTKRTHPAFLSLVAARFKNDIPLGISSKDNHEYSESFFGKHGVDTIANIIHSNDRNLCVLLGRALAEQGMFHDVSYVHKLRDSLNEVYQFEPHAATPSGIFTILSDCYSPTCAKGRVCYSITCPRRFEHINLQKQPTVSGSVIEDEKPIGDDWGSGVPKELLDSLSKQERVRQETIYELIKGEIEYVKDLQNTIKLIAQPLRIKDIIEPTRREQFVNEVFSNINAICSVNEKLLQKLLVRQRQSTVVSNVGDIFIEMAKEFVPYIEYGTNQFHAKIVLNDERNRNTELTKFIQEVERLKDFRKLSIESFLGRPTSRLLRYSLLLEGILKKTEENHEDIEAIKLAMVELKKITTAVDLAAGKAKNKIRLTELTAKLFSLDGDEKLLNLLEEGRSIIREGNLILKGTGTTGDKEVFVYLFDHMLVITRKKEDRYRIYRKPVYLEMAQIQVERNASRAAAGLARVGTVTEANPATQRTFPLTIIHPGRFGGAYVLNAATIADRQSWIEAIERQKATLISQKEVFKISPILDGSYFTRSNPIRCSCVYQGHIFVGTDSGLYIGRDSANITSGNLRFQYQRFLKVLEVEYVSQIDIIPKIEMLLLLQDKTLLLYPVRVLLEQCESFSVANDKIKPQKVGSSVTFFKQGTCQGQQLLCAVKSTPINTTVKVFEPIAGVKSSGFKLFKAGVDNLKLVKEFYIPSESKSIHFFSSKFCVGCVKGFELVDFTTLDTQGFLEPNDPTLDFVLKREQVRPIAIFRLQNGNFLLCYNDFGFFLDKLGRRYRPDWIINWCGTPDHFTFHDPYIIAYEPSFIEIRDIRTGQLQQFIPTSNLRVLGTDYPLLHCVMDSNEFQDQQYVFKLVKNE
ncbi:CNH domain-containing protein [Globomyces pollinis-pini]|nr:CNH domain-containing protein [Globomyces pollinis-pini]